MTPDDADAELHRLVGELRLRVGLPSTRTIAARAVGLGTAVSHSIVAAMLRGDAEGRRWPRRWEFFSVIVRVLGGNPLQLKELWAEATGRHPITPKAAATTTVMHTVDNHELSLLLRSVSALERIADAMERAFPPPPSETDLGQDHHINARQMAG